MLRRKWRTMSSGEPSAFEQHVERGARLKRTITPGGHGAHPVGRAPRSTDVLQRESGLSPEASLGDESERRGHQLSANPARAVGGVSQHDRALDVLARFGAHWTGHQSSARAATASPGAGRSGTGREPLSERLRRREPLVLRCRRLPLAEGRPMRDEREKVDADLAELDELLATLIELRADPPDGVAAADLPS